MGLFERYLTVWVALGMDAGVGLGLAHVNLVAAVFIWMMIHPMTIQIDGSAVKDMGKNRVGSS